MAKQLSNSILPAVKVVFVFPSGSTKAIESYHIKGIRDEDGKRPISATVILKSDTLDFVAHPYVGELLYNTLPMALAPHCSQNILIYPRNTAAAIEQFYKAVRSGDEK